MDSKNVELLVGGLALGGVVVGGILLIKKLDSKTTSSTSGSNAGDTGSTGTGNSVSNTAAANITISSVQVNSPIMPGQIATASIVLDNTGGQAGSVTVSGISKLNGAQEGTWSQQAVTVAPGQSQSVTMQSSGDISSIFEGDVLQVTFSLSSGGSVTESLQISSSSGGSSSNGSSGGSAPVGGLTIINVEVVTATPGTNAQASITVHNSGSQAATDTINGTILLNGTVEGHWYPQAVSLGAGQSQTYVIYSFDAISSIFAGDNLQAQFTLSNGSQAQASFSVT
jgi:uncharacterized protein YfaS (alpha-2-macroglobulin family)